MTNLIIIGAKWFDKVNGNTYCNAKAVNGQTGEVEFYIGYQYGYGGQYFYEAKKEAEKRYGADVRVFDSGCFHIKHADLKANRF